MPNQVKSWVVFWLPKGAPESAATIAGEIDQIEPPSFTQVQDYLPRNALEGRAFCVPYESASTPSSTIARVEYPIARRSAEPAAANPIPAASAPPFDMGAFAQAIGQSIQNAIAPIAQRLDQLEQRNAAMSQPVVGAMGMGMDPTTSKLLEVLIPRLLAPPPTPPPNPIQDRLLEVALASLGNNRKSRMSELIEQLTEIRLGKELANELKSEQSDNKDDSEGDEVGVMDVLKAATQMIRPTPPAAPATGQLAGPQNIFDDPSALQAAVMADPEKAAQAMRQLGKQYPDVAAIARNAMRAGEREARGE